MADGNKKVSELQKAFTFKSQGNQIFHHIPVYIKGGSEHTVFRLQTFRTQISVQWEKEKGWR